MKRVIFVFVIGLLLITTVAGAFGGIIGLDRPLSTCGTDWGDFGDYFGGVAGSLLSFLSILLLVYTNYLQGEQLSDAQRETLKRDLLAHVTKANDEIDRWSRSRGACAWCGLNLKRNKRRVC